MIPRRARIKVAAKIPVRRKIETQTPEIGEKIVNAEIENNACKSVEEEVLNSVEIEKPVEERIITDISDIVRNNNDTTAISSTTQEIDLKNDGIGNKITVNDSIIQPNIVPESKPITRRWIPKPKPLVSLGASIRRPKPIPNLNSSKEPTVESLKNQNIENEKPPNIISQDEGVPEVLVQVEPVLEVQNVDTKISNNINQSPIKSGSDSEKNSANPLSTSKLINRARIRPVPKFIRRNSVQGSASESEDDSRRTHSRIRTDSVCSTTSVTTEQTVNKDGVSTPKEKNISTKVQKLTRKSDQTRKVAEARKEFYTKFGSNKPDKKRLTMMDLIYYNPVSNPMPQNRKQSLSEPDVITIGSKIPVEEEIEDDPDATKYEEDINPVPQVKVGPNGEIILDEQSLVIEQTGMKKGREQLANSKIIDGDDQNRAYGIYKRPKRTKDWPAIETLRFYRSLNTLGTDFSMMVSLFPGRTRRDLKVKFKKEERLNQQLIDKALTNPNEFYLEDLEKQARIEQEIIDKKLFKKSIAGEANSSKPAKTKKRLPSKFARQMDELIYTTKKRKPKKKHDLYTVLEKAMTNALDSDSESDEEFVPKYKIIKLNPPIKRLPRLTKSQTEPIDDVTSEEEQEEENEEMSIIINIDEHNNNNNSNAIAVPTEVRDEESEENIKNSHKSPAEEINSEDERTPLEMQTDDIQQPPGEESSESLGQQSDEENSGILEQPPDEENSDPLEQPLDEENSELVEQELDEENSEILEQPLDEENSDLSEQPLDEENSEILERPLDEENSDLSEQPLDEENSEILEELESSLDGEENTETTEEMETSREPEGLTIPNILPNNMSTVEPGSLMILSSVGPDGRPIYKVFMVTPNQNKLPVNLSQDVVQSLANSLGHAESITLDLPVVDKTPE